ncbi:solanesyl diphosphate synthase 1, chloroplastic-like isoform X2 [Quercus robur]|uniref:solanesyl diphosphate synthase 1, chloroplastic-like isoform X2 n=1 Tax=Quercus robur TaxID=38942 RepID=UPI0021615AD9|nr:solanesyl diphosphate synthase 1, chloroplastic-like isoform X2 [Quercus robur]
MMSMTCHNLDFGFTKTVFDLYACGCSSNASFCRSSVRNYAKSSSSSRKLVDRRRGIALCRVSSTSSSVRNYAKSSSSSRKLVDRRRGIALCRVSSTNTPATLLSEVAQGVPPLLDLKEESRGPISLKNLFELVADDLQTLNQNLQSIVGAENPVLMSAAEQIFGAGGKRMRPALVFLVSRATSELAGLKELTTEHRRLAEIIEMIHTASLIHDDVLDDSNMRRGQETVHQMYGTRVAVLAGDFMFAQSSWYLANLENLEVIKLISQVIKDFASGEIKQASSLFDCDLKLEEYLLKSYYKTASLIAASTKGAAVFSGVDSTITQKMYEYGKNLGLAFQVVDDILDFTQSAEQLGKPAGSDLVNGNLTAPVIFALEKEPKLRDIIESEFSEPGSLNEAIELVKSCGGIERAQELAKEKADLAIQNLQCLPESAFRLALEDMVLYNLERIV